MVTVDETLARVSEPNPPPSPPSSPPPVFAGLEINTQLQSVERQGEEYGDFITLGADLHLPNLQPVNHVPTTAAVDHPAAPPPPQDISSTKVDVIGELEQVMEEMERGEPIPTLMETANNIFARANAPNPPTPPPSPPPPVYTGLEINTQPQLAERHCGGHSDCMPLGAIPRTVEQQSSWTAAPTMYARPVPQGGIMQPLHLHGQAGAYSQGQYMPYHQPLGNIPTMAVVSQPAVAVGPCVLKCVPAPRLSDGQSLRFVGVLKRKREKEQTNEQPYVKKPPNAFMLFMKEHRANVGTELQGRGSAAINTVLGQIWNSLTKEEQAKYYHQAETERVLHAQRHPEWSPSDKYGKKRKRERSKAPTRTDASASQPDEDTQQAKRPCVTLMQTAPMEPLWSSHPAVMRPHDVHTVLVPEAPHTQTVQVQQPNTQTVATVHVPVHHLPQLCEVSPAFTLVSPETASMSLASPAAPTQPESTNY
ncbi:hypothetical protein ABVT39_022960 [Epinephelus coioides]